MNKILKALLSTIAILMLAANIQLFYLLDIKFSLITEAKATQKHTHSSSDISYFDEKVKVIVASSCSVFGSRLLCQ